MFISFFLIGNRVLEKYTSSRALSKYVWVLVVVFVLFFDSTILYTRGGPKIYFHGRFQGTSDPWAEIQSYARMHSQKDDLFIVPPYANDFTTYSLRAILGDWAEGSTLIYLDNQFCQQWFARMRDLGCTPGNWFEGYDTLTTDHILKVAQKYGARFIITQKPKTFSLKKLYENVNFILYEATPREPQKRGISNQRSP
jgi:hypothetical protein